MLIPFRRHTASCKFRDRGRKYRACACPIAVEGTLRDAYIRKTLDVRSWDAAQKIIRDWEVEGTQEKVLLTAALKRFIKDAESRGLSAEWLGKLNHMKKELEAFFGDVPLRSITPDGMAKFRESWKVNSTTSRKKLERTRSFFKFCVGRDWIEKNPAKELRQPKESPIEKKPFDDVELDKINGAIPFYPKKGIYGDGSAERIRAFVSVLRWTGLRIRDVVALKKSSIQDGLITVRAHKNGKPIKLPVHSEMDEALKTVKNEGEYFFWSGVGNPRSCVSDWQRTFIRLSEVAGVHVHAHRYRHTFAVHLLSKGVPVSEVAAILGNSSRIIEKHYSQWIKKRQDSLEAAVKATW